MPFDPTVMDMPIDPNWEQYKAPAFQEQPSGFDPSAIDAIPGDDQRSPNDASLGGIPLNSVFTPKYFSAPNEQYPVASMGTIAKAYMVDDPYAKMKVFAKGRGLPISRYGVHDGDIVFLGDDGMIYYEQPPAKMDVLGAAKGFVPAVPQAVGTGLGYMFGGTPGGMVAGGALELARKGGGVILGEEVDAIEIAADAAVETALGAFEGLSINGLFGAGKKAVNVPKLASLSKPQRQAVKLAGESAFTPELGDAYAVWKDAAEKYGIDLNLAQASQSADLAEAYKLLRDLPETQRAAIKSIEAQDKQIQGAALDLFEALGQKTDNAIAGANLVDAANKSLVAAKEARSEAVRPIYERAFKESAPVDTDNAQRVLSELINELPEGSSNRSALNKLYGMFFEGNTPITDLRKLDMVKREIDAIMNGVHPLSDQFVKTTRGDLFRRLGKVKNELVTAADDASGGLYKQARDKFIELTPPIEEARKSVLGQIAKLEGDGVSNAATKLLSGANVTPETAKRSMNYIRSIDPEAADSAITSFLSSQVDAIKASQKGTVENISGKLYQRLFGSEKQRKILQAVMAPDKYEQLQDFMLVMRKASITSGRESATAARQEMLKAMGRQARTKMFTAKEFVTSPLETARGLMNDSVETALNAQYRTRMFDALSTGAYADKIKQLKRLDPRTEKFARTLAFTLTQMLAVPAKKAGAAARQENIIPEDIKDFVTRRGLESQER